MRGSDVHDGAAAAESRVTAPVRLLEWVFNLLSAPVRKKWIDGFTGEGWITLSCCCRTFSSLHLLWQYTVCHLIWIKASPRQYDNISILWSIWFMIYLQGCADHQVSVIFINPSLLTKTSDWFCCDVCFFLPCFHNLKNMFYNVTVETVTQQCKSPHCLNHIIAFFLSFYKCSDSWEHNWTLRSVLRNGCGRKMCISHLNEI